MRWVRMVTCAATGETFDTTELIGARTGEISAGTSAMFAKTGVNCGMTCEMETTEPREPSGATSTKTSGTCVPTAAIFGMTAVTSGAIAETFATTGEGNILALPIWGRLRERRRVRPAAAFQLGITEGSRIQT